MESPAVRKKLEDDENRSKRQAQEDAATSIRADIERSNDQFIGGQKQQLKSTVDNQDVLLGQLGESVERLGKMGEAVNTELKEQSRLLDSLDQEMGDASEKMNFVQAKLSKLLKTKDGCQIWTVVILTVILVILGNGYDAIFFTVFNMIVVALVIWA